MPKYVCTRQCFWGPTPDQHRMWYIGEPCNYTEDVMPKDKNGNIRHFKRVDKEVVETAPEPEPQDPKHLTMNYDIDKPVNSMKKDELIAMLRGMGEKVDDDMDFMEIRKLAYKKLNG